MKTRLIEIIKVLKEVIKETNLNITDNTLLEQASTYHRGELSQENKEKNMSNYDKSKITQPSNDKFKGKVILSTDKQKKLMNTLKIPFTDKTSIKEAKELIELKLGKSKYKEE